MIKTIGLALAVLLGANAAQAQSVYRCEMDGALDDWAGPWLVFAVRPDQKSALVGHPVYAYFEGGMAEAKVTSNTKSRTKLQWSVNAYDSRKTRTTMVYTATFLKSNNTVQIDANALGFSQRFNGRGSCAQISAAEMQAIQSQIGG
ncbi:MAG: hypothetical protein AAGF74_07350 [Pseudomonadota bacterium]